MARGDNLKSGNEKTWHEGYSLMADGQGNALRIILCRLDTTKIPKKRLPDIDLIEKLPHRIIVLDDNKTVAHEVINAVYDKNIKYLHNLIQIPGYALLSGLDDYVKWLLIINRGLPNSKHLILPPGNPTIGGEIKTKVGPHDEFVMTNTFMHYPSYNKKLMKTTLSYRSSALTTLICDFGQHSKKYKVLCHHPGKYRSKTISSSYLWRKLNLPFTPEIVRKTVSE